MKRSTGFVAVSLLLGITLFGVYRAVRTSAASPTEGGAPPATQATGTNPEAADIAALRSQVAQLSRLVRAQGQSLASAPPAKADDPDAKDPRSDPEARAAAQRAYHDYIAGIEAAFRKEARDPRWSSATSAAVQTALVTDDELRRLTRGVDCRSRTCRVEIADDGSGSLGKLLPMFAQHVGKELPSVAFDRVEDPSGATTMVLYMTRPDATRQ